MAHTPNELHDEFPNAAEAIHRLKQEDRHFARLAHEYHGLTRQIHRAETDVEPMEDLALDTLKKQRLALADAIATILRADAEAHGCTCGGTGACGKADPQKVA